MVKITPFHTLYNGRCELIEVGGGIKKFSYLELTMDRNGSYTIYLFERGELLYIPVYSVRTDIPFSTGPHKRFIDLEKII